MATRLHSGFSLLLMVIAIVGLSVANPARADDCGELLQRADSARQTRDAATLKQASTRVRSLCDSAEKEQQLRRVTASVLLSNLMKEHEDLIEHPERYEQELDEVLVYDGNAWAANALKGDVLNAQGRFGDATRRYQQAIDGLDALAKQDTQTADSRESIYRKAELARLAAASGPKPEFVKGTTGRSGRPGGLNAPRGVKVMEQHQQSEQADCRKSPKLATRGPVQAAVAMPIQFEFNSTSFTELGGQYAQEAVTMVDAQAAQKASLVVRLVGHTDSKGEHVYNEKLSLSRAEAVRDWLSSKLAKTVEIDVAGCGKRLPLDLGSNQAEQRYGAEQIDQMNRRVEIEFLDN